MTRSLRFLPKRALAEITQRTTEGKFLFSPDERVNRVIIGCIAEAQEKTDARVHAVAVLSGHFHLLASFEKVDKMADFMCHLKANLTKKLNSIHGRSGPMYARRYDHVPVTREPEAQLARLQYVLSQGTKEGLVASPLEWPGVHSARALTTDGVLKGARVDRQQYYARRRRGEDVSILDVLEELELKLEPLPALADLDVDARREATQSLIQRIEDDVVADHRVEGTKPAGVAAVLARKPWEKPKKPPERRPLPWVHAYCPTERRRWIDARREFEVSYRVAANRLKDGDRDVEFPPNCFPPRLPFVPPSIEDG